jgi:two-component system response regulator DegU
LNTPNEEHAGRKTRILVCEDDPRYRRLLIKRLALQPDFAVSECSSGEQAILRAQKAQAEEAAFDLLLLDLELPKISGLEVIEALASALDILVLTSFNSEERVFIALRDGAAGYLLKGATSPPLEEAIRDVLAGGTVIESRLARRFWNYFAGQRGRSAQDFGLDEQELELLEVVAKGLSNPEAASALGSTRRSIKGRLAQIYRKLQVQTRVEAVSKALAAGLIEL